MESKEFVEHVKTFTEGLDKEHLEYAVIVINPANEEQHEVCVSISTTSGCERLAEGLFVACHNNIPSSQRFVEAIVSRVMMHIDKIMKKRAKPKVKFYKN